jgi:hypothetical protein
MPAIVRNNPRQKINRKERHQENQYKHVLWGEQIHKAGSFL